jgi:hypothetical protein
MKQRAVLRLVLTGLVAFLSLALAAQPASAHSVSASSVVYNGGYFCAIGGATIGYDHSSKAATATARTEGRVTGSTSCDTIDVFAPGHLAVRYELIYLRTRDSTWQLCRSTDWTFNSTYTWEVSVSNTYGGPQPCEPGQYGTRTYSYVWDGSAWQGGVKWSGTHPMPV